MQRQRTSPGPAVLPRSVLRPVMAAAEDALPPGWSQAVAEDGAVFYYNAAGESQWEKPVASSEEPDGELPPGEGSVEPADLIAEMKNNMKVEIMLHRKALAQGARKGSASVDNKNP